MDSFPYDHLVIDDFFPLDKARKLSQEFPEYDSNLWYQYKNPLENKKSSNNWWDFPPETYKTFCFLNSCEFLNTLREKTGIQKLYPDIGLHGGGWHIHDRGGKLNIHLDYSIHPKSGLQRKLNLIVKDGKVNGVVVLSYGHIITKKYPLRREYYNVFNRAILFDTTQNSWHGLPQPLSCPL